VTAQLLLRLDLLRNGNGRLAAELDHLGHGLVEGRLLSPVIDARVVVLLLLVPKLGDCRQQLLKIQKSSLIRMHFWGNKEYMYIPCRDWVPP